MKATRALANKAAAAASICYVSAPKEATEVLANGLISEKLAACVHVIPQVTSVYTWEGRVERDKEDLLMIKTRTELVDDLITFVKNTHPYTTPEVISVKLENGSPEYLKWLQDVTE